MKSLLFTILSFFALTLNAQQAPDFTITDTDGNVHKLYDDYLNQGKTVVIKLFFTSCPPCISLSPMLEQKYQQWGAGQYDVQFFEFSILTSDSNADVAKFKEDYSVTFPGAGYDGGGKDAADPYKTGLYGPYYGTPSVIVIAPTGDVTMGFAYDEFDDVIASTGATGMDTGVPNNTFTTYSLNVNAVGGTTALPADTKFILKPANAESPRYDILDLNGDSLTFQYPSATFPEIENPVVILESKFKAIDESINAVDLLKIRKHILELEPFTSESKLLAADVNSDNKINAVDLLNLQKALLELIDEFPNQTPAWKTIPEVIELQPSISNSVDLDVQLVKIGNVN